MMEDEEYLLPGQESAKARSNVPAGLPDYSLESSAADVPAAEEHPSPVGENIAGYLEASSGERFFLHPGLNVVGRGEVDFRLADKAISRRHCVLEVTPDGDRGFGYLLYDIGVLEGTPSINGVYLERRTLRLGKQEKVVVYHGTRIEIGRTYLLLKSEV